MKFAHCQQYNYAGRRVGGGGGGGGELMMNSLSSLFHIKIA